MINESSMNIFPKSNAVNGQEGLVDISTITSGYNGVFTLPHNMYLSKPYAQFTANLDNTEAKAGKINVVIKDSKDNVVGERDITGDDVDMGKVANVPFVAVNKKGETYKIAITFTGITKGTIYGVLNVIPR